MFMSCYLYRDSVVVRVVKKQQRPNSWNKVAGKRQTTSALVFLPHTDLCAHRHVLRDDLRGQFEDADGACSVFVLQIVPLFTSTRACA